MSQTQVVSAAPKQSWLSKLLGIPAGQNLVWWLIGKQGNPKAQILGFVAFFVIFWIAYQSPWAATAMMLAMYLHEAGHYVLFVANGIKARVLLLFPLGAVAAPITKEEDERSDLLPWWNIGWILQAGPTMNVVQMIIGVILVHTGFLPLLGLNMVYINGMLAVFNLLPLWNMDGGQLFGVIFSSLKEEYDVYLAVFGVVISVLIVAVILTTAISHGFLGVLWAIFKYFGPLSFFLLFAAGIWHKQGKDNPLHWKSVQAMTVKQVVIQLAYYFSLVILTLFLFTL